MQRDESITSCQCYPEAYGLNRGCKGQRWECWVLKEARDWQTPEGQARNRAKYLEKVEQRHKEAASQPTFSELAIRLKKLGIPGAALAVLENPNSTVALEGAKKFWFGDKRLQPALVLSGGVGSGKTVAAAFVCMEWAKRHAWNQNASGGHADPLLWIDGPALTKLGNFDASQQIVDMAYAAKLLVVDDAGREGTKGALGKISDIIMNRLDNFKATVLSTNLTGENFRARYGDALADRLRADALIPALGAVKSMRAAK